MPDNVFHMIQTADSITFSFSSTMENIDQVCTRITGYLRERIRHIDPFLFPINLVIREGLTNAVRHGNAGDPQKLVRFVLWIEDNQWIKLEIEDQGQGFDWQQQSAEMSDSNDHGRGIPIMGTYFSH
jgi:serine/threonine-protein kinase RsbW